MTLNINKLKSEIERSKFGKSEIASKCGIDRKTIENVLSGRDPKVSTITSLANFLGIKISYLFDEEEIEIREAGRDYVEKGKIEHQGPEYAGGASEAIMRDMIDQLKSQLADKERIIKMMEQRQ